MEKPLVVYDGECAFCRFWVERWKSETGDRAGYAPFQKLAAKYPELGAEKFRKAVHLILPDGTVASGARASFMLMAATGVRRWPLALYERLPGFAFASEKGYGLIKRHRAAFLRVSRLLWGEDPAAASHTLVRAVFLRALGAIYAVALLSLLVQIPGLYGDDGLLPVVDTLAAVRARFGPGGAWFFPSLAWLFPSGGFLQLLALAGAACGVAMTLGIFARPVAFGAWAAALSIVAVGGDFTAFQWDALLLEAGFLAIFLARPAEARPSRMIVGLYRLLVFRLMFGSGLVKLLSGDAAWRGLTALTRHYETQPLPNPIAWYAHHLPASVHRVSAVGLFAVELVLPFLIFAPRRPRLLAAAGVAGLQLLILATGNYAYFNWLALALCLFLLDDALLARLLPKRVVARALPPASTPAEAVPSRAWKAFAPLLLALALMQVASLVADRRLPVVAQARAVFAPFRLVNDYGLFAVMTMNRPEIVIEGSMDGREWKAYEFRYKPGDVKRAPPWVAPHQPRLDWQMWFAALGAPGDSPWIANLATRLLQGSAPVERLFARVPFADAPPRYLRAVLYDYRFTTPRERALDGAWWRREMRAEYFPAVSIR